MPGLCTNSANMHSELLRMESLSCEPHRTYESHTHMPKTPEMVSEGTTGGIDCSTQQQRSANHCIRQLLLQHVPDRQEQRRCQLQLESSRQQGPPARRGTAHTHKAVYCGQVNTNHQEYHMMKQRHFRQSESLCPLCVGDHGNTVHS